MSERSEKAAPTRELERFRVQQARATLWFDVSREVEGVAVGLMDAGFDGRALRLLASSTLDAPSELRGRVLAAAEELGEAPLTDDAAVLILAREQARDILSGRCSPYSGASVIWSLSDLVSGPEDRLYDPFIYAASEWEDRPQDRELFDQEIVGEAAAFLRDQPPGG